MPRNLQETEYRPNDTFQTGQPDDKVNGMSEATQRLQYDNQNMVSAIVERVAYSRGESLVAVTLREVTDIENSSVDNHIKLQILGDIVEALRKIQENEPDQKQYIDRAAKAVHEHSGTILGIKTEAQQGVIAAMDEQLIQRVMEKKQVDREEAMKILAAVPA